jgi:hypothetical protein
LQPRWTPYARWVSLSDEIFPGHRRLDFVQTEWARGWGYGTMGFAEAARFLTENRAQFRATIDQVGLVIFFLQRHRVELALKELLVAHRGDLPTTHSLKTLWRACEQAVGTGDEGWTYLDSAGAELIALLHECDPASDAYRYPVDRAGNAHERPKFINLAALEKHVDGLTSAIAGYMAYSEEARQWEAEMQREFELDMRQEYGDY